MSIKPGKYIHFKGNEYEVIGTATHSETLEELVVYCALDGDDKLWVRPAFMWNEVVEHNGCRVKRFTHEDEINTDSLAVVGLNGVNSSSTNDEKVDLFMFLFRGREDVYARRWESKDGQKTGYTPVCRNEWVMGVCEKPRVKCSNCKNREYVPFDKQTVARHLAGKEVAGIYPMLLDETCLFLAIDFDDEDWQKDICAVRSACERYHIPIG